jgi:hypothetical protein
MFWAIGTFVIKILTISNIEAGAWLGADGENYLSGYEALVNNGIFSTDWRLHYWPAGYPLFILLLSFLGKSWLLATISIFQSLVYSFAVYFFVSQLLKTKFRNYSYFVCILLLFNPTLSLSSICIGYESIAASGLLIVLGLLIQDLTNSTRDLFLRNIAIASAVVAFITFFQPRLLLSGIIGLAIWIFVQKPIKYASLILLLTVSIIAISPSLLVLRNQKANGFSAISTNLGGTMNLGAGDKADGSYNPKGNYGVPCPTIAGNAAVQDSHLTKCVIDWYLSNPVKALNLFANKAVFFWSPWSGPEAVGSMARNPWLKVAPVINIAKNSQDGNKLVYGLPGKIISWLWIIGSIYLLTVGFWQLWKTKGIERMIAAFAITQIALNWIVAIGTLGDHRQRLPIMSLSILLQAIGLKTVLKGKKDLLSTGPDLPIKSQIPAN